MFQTLQYVNAALSRAQPELPPTAKIVANRMTFASFPIIGYSLTSDTVPQTDLWELATYEIKPRLNRLPGVSRILVQGGQEPEFHIIPDPAKLLQTQITVPNLLDAIGRNWARAGDKALPVRGASADDSPVRRVAKRKLAVLFERRHELIGIQANRDLDDLIELRAFL